MIHLKQTFYFLNLDANFGRKIEYLDGRITEFEESLYVSLEQNNVTRLSQKGKVMICIV